MYKALYRKWRPLNFDDVVSQPHITTTLKNQIINEKTAHAYLFTGSRGTGKTTCARIFAKTINCLDISEGNPCLKCEVCRGSDDGTLTDIIEIDAASNNGVEDIRELREAAIFSPEFCRFKIYIIDEVHMLSTNAFNALLKIMEEPPAYVKFILATTEVHKVPATILSRCQRFDFRRIRTEDIVSRLKYISSQEGIVITDDAASLIAKISDGGMRDALSLLDQCIAFSENVTVETVSTAAGIAGRDYLFSLLDCMVNKNASEAISIIDSLYSMSKDIQRLCDELLSQMRNLMLVKTVPDKTELLACLPDEIEKLSELSKKISLDEILLKLELLQECSERLTRSVNRRTEFEMCMIKLCSSHNKQAAIATSPNICALEERIAQLERLIEGGSISSQDKPKKAPEKKKTDIPPPQVQVPPEQEEPAAQEEFKPLSCWAEILEDFSGINPAVSGALKDSQAYVSGGVLVIIAKNQFFMSLFRIKENALSLSDVIKKHTGISYTIRAKAEKPQETAGNPVDRLIDKAKQSGIQVEIK